MSQVLVDKPQYLQNEGFTPRRRSCDDTPAITRPHPRRLVTRLLPLGSKLINGPSNTRLSSAPSPSNWLSSSSAPADSISFRPPILVLRNDAAGHSLESSSTPVPASLVPGPNPLTSAATPQIGPSTLNPSAADRKNDSYSISSGESRVADELPAGTSDPSPLGHASNTTYPSAVDLVVGDEPNAVLTSSSSPSPQLPIPKSPTPDHDLQQQLAAKEAALQEALALQADLEAKNRCLSSLSEQQARELHVLREAFTRLRHLFDSQTEEVRKLDSSLQAERDRASDLGGEVFGLRLEMGRLNSKMGEKEARARSFEEQNQGLRRTIAKLKNTLEDERAQTLSRPQHTRFQSEIVATSAQEAKAGNELGWEVMERKLAKAERQLRVLDNISRLKTEAHGDSVFAKIKKPPRYTPTPARADVSDIIAVVKELNKAIKDISSLLPTFATPSYGSSGPSEVASGEAALNHRAGLLRWLRVVRRRASQDNPNWRFFFQVALEIFFVHWCVDIIEANYPRRPSFGEFLLDACAHSGPSMPATSLYVPHQICGRQIPIIPLGEPSTPYTPYITDIIAELYNIRAVAGVTFSSSASDSASNLYDTVIQGKMVSMLKAAYDLRLALAEKELFDGVDIKVVTPGTVFQGGCMEDAYPDHILGKVELEAGTVLGMTAIGIQQKAGYLAGDMVLVRPRVVVCHRTM